MRARAKSPCNQVSSVLRFKDTAKVFPLRRSWSFQKKTWFSGRQFARFAQSFRPSEQVFTDSGNETKTENQKLRLDLQSQTTISLLVSIKISLNVRREKFHDLVVLKTIKFESFPQKTLDYTVINLYSQKLSTLTIA